MREVLDARGELRAVVGDGIFNLIHRGVALLDAVQSAKQGRSGQEYK